MKIVFMGTPDFAVPSLKKLCELHEVAAVVTQPDKPRGRGYIMTPSPVKVFAMSQNIPIYQPETLKGDALLPLLNEIIPDVIVVVAYGKILPPYILDFPKYGCINLHGSLLPEYRGAAPMQRAIIDGRKETGVTTMFMAKELDSGDILESAKTQIDDLDNFETVHDRLSVLGATLLISTLDKLKDNKILPQKQNEALATYAAKIEKGDCLIDFSKPVRQIHDKIRGLSPYPLSFAYLDRRMIKFISSVIVSNEAAGAPCGTVVSLDDNKIEIACLDGIIGITSLLPEGKSKMSAKDFINGRKIKVGDIFLSEK